MSFLLDTNVMSESRKRQPNPGVSEWISTTQPQRFHISVITVGEIGRAITRLKERGDQRQTAMLGSWLDEVVDGFGDRVLPVDLSVVRQWASQTTSQPLATSDALIAATAVAHALTLVTCNVKDFERAPVRVITPSAIRGRHPLNGVDHRGHSIDLESAAPLRGCRPL